MRETPDPNLRLDLDAAYLAAEQVLADDTAAQRRRAAVLAAVQAATPSPVQELTNHITDKKQAANEPQWWRGGLAWRGAVAASVMLCSSLLVWRVSEEPGAVLGDNKVLAQRAPLDVAPKPAPTSTPTPAPKPAPTSAAVPVPMPKARPSAAPTTMEKNATTQADAAAAPLPAPAQMRAEAAMPNAASDAAPIAAPVAAPIAAPVAAPVAAPTAAPPDVVRESTSTLPPALLPPSAARAPAGPPPARVVQAAPASAQLSGALAGGAEARPAARDAAITAKRLAPPKAAVDQDRDSDGRTALALAVLRGDAAAVTQLLAQGADPLVPDRYGQTPRGYARSLGNAAVLEAMGL
jgi:hypothetical protein